MELQFPYGFLKGTVLKMFETISKPNIDFRVNHGVTKDLKF